MSAMSLWRFITQRTQSEGVKTNKSSNEKSKSSANLVPPELPLIASAHVLFRRASRGGKFTSRVFRHMT